MSAAARMVCFDFVAAPAGRISRLRAGRSLHSTSSRCAAISRPSRSSAMWSRARAILGGDAPRSETTGAYDRTRARGCRRCTRVLEGARGGLAKDARPTLLGAQDRQCFEQVAEEPTGKGPLAAFDAFVEIYDIKYEK